MLMDPRLPYLSGLDVMTAIRSEFADARVIVLTTFEGDTDVQKAFKAGARGHLLKSMPAQQIIDTIWQVHSGKKSVPPRIAAYLAEHLGDETLRTGDGELTRSRGLQSES
jgi:DNA-binding NarL/FixJ family response regulator